MKFYKLLNEDLTCNGYQYEIGKEHNHDGPLEMRLNGFHSCIDPKACTLYYKPHESRLFEVEVGNERLEDGPNVVSRFIKLVREIEGKEKDDLFTGDVKWEWEGCTTWGKMNKGVKVGEWYFEFNNHARYNPTGSHYSHTLIYANDGMLVDICNR